jgi:hypothetical protein
MKRALGIVLVALALGMLGYRLTNIDLVPFARDEPMFLSAARQQLDTGELLLANPFYGNMRVRYGPTAFWFFGLVQLLFGDDPRFAVLAIGLIVTAAQLAFALALTRLLDESAIFFGVFVAWIASSPYLFHWSRLAWDLTNVAGVFAVVALLPNPRALSPGRALALGSILGLSVATHLLVTPLLIAVGVALAWEWRSRRQRLPAALAIASFLGVTSPYLFFLLFRAPARPARRYHLPFSLARLGTTMLDAPRLATTWGMDYFFDGTWPDFEGWLGAGPAAAVGMLSLLALTMCCAGAAAGVAIALTASDERLRRMGRVALIAWGVTVLLLAVIGLKPFLHYHFPAIWVPIFGVAVSVWWLRRQSRPWGSVALIAMAAIALAQFLVIVEWMGYIRARGGTREDVKFAYLAAYGTPLGGLTEAMRTACSVREGQIVIWNETNMHRFPFEYLARSEPTCRAKSIDICTPSPRSFEKLCASPPAGSRVVRFRYAAERGGALRVD